ncbi:MAG: hypothetical protein LIP23_09470, partial [Planctomycetes bacterium]|nr:hypothetical protein [Planctomycetota bacterium]
STGIIRYCIDCEAGFKSPKTGTDFYYRVKAAYQCDDAGAIKSYRNYLNELPKESYNKCIEDSAYRAMVNACSP